MPTQFHIGAASNGDGRLAGPDYAQVMNAGGASQYAAKRRRSSVRKPSGRRSSLPHEGMLTTFEKEKLMATSNRTSKALKASFSRHEGAMLPSSADFDL